MSRGITPRFTTWCPEPTTPLGRDNPDGAPLEREVDDVRTMRAKCPCLPGTAHARLEVTCPPQRGTGQRILEDSAFGRLNGEPL
jgi:hypothetical protein